MESQVNLATLFLIGMTTGAMFTNVIHCVKEKTRFDELRELKRRYDVLEELLNKKG